jgi:DNA-binding Xre family transcriptional regulator
MSVSYNKLWKLMIDKNINKTRLREEAGISSNAMAKLGRNESVRVDVLVKICNHLGCTMDDIMEIIPDEAGESHA